LMLMADPPPHGSTEEHSPTTWHPT
jgi:hypothetical protein